MIKQYPPLSEQRWRVPGGVKITRWWHVAGRTVSASLTVPDVPAGSVREAELERQMIEEAFVPLLEAECQARFGEGTVVAVAGEPGEYVYERPLGSPALTDPTNGEGRLPPLPGAEDGLALARMARDEVRQQLAEWEECRERMDRRMQEDRYREDLIRCALELSRALLARPENAGRAGSDLVDDAVRLSGELLAEVGTRVSRRFHGGGEPAGEKHDHATL